MWLRYGSGLLMAGLLWGCSMVTSTQPSPPSGHPSLFHTDPTDMAILQAVRREQDSLLSTCTQQQSCDQVYFTRAMVLLFQNREEAATSFQQAIAVAPNGPFAEPSTLWIRFLANRSFYPTSIDKPSEVLLGVMKGTVRAWLERPHAAVGTAKSANPEMVKNLDPSVHNLQLQIRTRDKRIAELTDQLEALKQIDLDSSGTNKMPHPRKSPK